MEEESQQITSARQSLAKIRQDARQTRSIDALRKQFDKLHSLRRQYLEDFDLQVMIADIHQEVIERARYLRGDAPGAAPTQADPAAILLPGIVQPSTSQSLVKAPPTGMTPIPPAAKPFARRPRTMLNSDDAAEIPPEVPRLDPKSWQTILSLAAFLCFVVLVGFFYLIQTARRINIPQDTSKVEPAAKQQKVNEGASGAPVAPTLRLYTDLAPGVATVDSEAPRTLTDGELTLDNLAQGQHTVKVSGANGTATFQFEVSGRNAPQVLGTPQTNNALVVLVSQQDGRGTLVSSGGKSTVLLDGNMAGEVDAPAGLQLVGLGTADHDLQLVRGREHQRFVMTYTAAPVLTVFVKSDPNTGILQIMAGVEGADIYIENVMFRRKTERGPTRISLREGKYPIKIHKEGFLDPAPIWAEVKKAEVTTVQFQLAPTGEVAALQIRGALPGTTAYLDHEFVTAVGSDGSVRISSIRPGEHSIELRHDRAITKKLVRSFKAGEVMTLSGSDVALDKANVETKPASTAPLGTEGTAAPVSNQDNALDASRVQKGGGFVPYDTPKSPGHYSFRTQGKVGGFLKKSKLQWYAAYQDIDNYVLFILDGKHAEVREMRRGKTISWNRIPFEVDSSNWVQVDMTVKPALVSARVKTAGDGWMDIGTVNSNGRDFTQNKVGFYIPSKDEVAVANFKFLNR